MGDAQYLTWGDARLLQQPPRGFDDRSPPIIRFLFSPAGLRIVDLERSEALAADPSVCAHQDGLVPACSHIMGNDVLVHLPSLPAPNVSQRAERGLFLLG